MNSFDSSRLAEIQSSEPSPLLLALQDIASGTAKSWIWVTLAMQDIKLRYRGSTLGPFWLTISTIVLMCSMGLIYSTLFSMDVKSYLPYLGLGFITWGYISSTVNEGCGTFTNAESVIQTVPMPFFVHAWRTVCRNIIVFAHNIIIIPVLLIVFQIPITWRIFELVPALAFYVLNGLWISVFFGMLSARFRDVPPIITNFLQVLFFLTPVIFPVSAMGHFRSFADFNPAFAAIDVVRAPLLGVPTNDYSWPMLTAITVTGCVGTLLIFARFRSRIAYWI